MSSIRAYPPLPIRQDWAPAYLAARAGAVNRDFAFSFRDAEGMPAADGTRYHGGVDWFAPAGAVISAPRAGRIIRADSSTDSSGQVFGGVLSIEEESGLVWVMRHVQPTRPVGALVHAGDPVATVHPWDAGSTHLHLELWRSASGGYRIENALDPADVQWDTSVAVQPTPASAYYFEELPAAKGGTGPDIVGQARGYAGALKAAAIAALMRARGWRVSTLHGDDGRYYLLRWAPGTYGQRFRFGPWGSEEDRSAKARERTGNTGRTMRLYYGRAASLYPWPFAGGDS